MKNNNRKGKLIAVAAAGVLGLSLLVGSISSFATPGRVGFIGEAKARQIALSNTGLKEAEVTFVRTSLDLDNGNYEYDVEFYKGNVEYDYEIDAKTGRILSYDKEIEGFNIPGKANTNTTTTTQQNVNTNTTNTTANQAITADKAKEIALKHVGLKAEEVNFIKAELDKERGQSVYDVEFYKGNVEYDFEIDVKTGKILKADYDIENYVIPGTSVANTSLEKAKEIALKQAGVDAAKAKFVKAELDIENGVLLYDIEFYVDNVEYDFEIDAKTGKVLEFDKDIENFVIQNNVKPNVNANTNTAANNAGISLETAKEVALQHAGLTAAQVTFTKANLDYDDGRSYYDIEFRVGTAEYDFEIDVKTGKVLDYDYDLNDGRWEDDRNNGYTNGNAGDFDEDFDDIDRADRDFDREDDRDYDYDDDNDDDDDEWDD